MSIKKELEALAKSQDNLTKFLQGLSVERDKWYKLEVSFAKDINGKVLIDGYRVTIH